MTLNEMLTKVLPTKVIKYYIEGRPQGKFEYGA